jgi:hypothetical protein
MVKSSKQVNEVESEITEEQPVLLVHSEPPINPVMQPAPFQPIQPSVQHVEQEQKPIIKISEIFQNINKPSKKVLDFNMTVADVDIDIDIDEDIEVGIETEEILETEVPESNNIVDVKNAMNAINLDSLKQATIPRDTLQVKPDLGIQQPEILESPVSQINKSTDDMLNSLLSNIDTEKKPDKDAISVESLFQKYSKRNS